MMARWLMRNYGAQAAQEAVSAWTSHSQRQRAERTATPCKAVVAFALPIESGGLIDLLHQRLDARNGRFTEYDGLLDGARVVAIESGVGVKAASDAAQDALQLHRPPWLIAAGFSAALQPQLRRGDLLVATELNDAYGNLLRIPMTMEATPGVHVGRLLTLDQPLPTPAEKEQAGRQYEALAYDHETMAVAQVSRHAGVPLMAIRVVNETLEQQAPSEFAGIADQEHLSGKLGAAAGALWQRPSVVKDWWTLKNNAMEDADRLGRFVAGILRQLAPAQAERPSSQESPRTSPAPGATPS